LTDAPAELPVVSVGGTSPFISSAFNKLSEIMSTSVDDETPGNKKKAKKSKNTLPSISKDGESSNRNQMRKSASTVDVNPLRSPQMNKISYTQIACITQLSDIEFN
jgi:hypothetical protein